MDRGLITLWVEKFHLGVAPPVLVRTTPRQHLYPLNWHPRFSPFLCLPRPHNRGASYFLLLSHCGSRPASLRAVQLEGLRAQRRHQRPGGHRGRSALRHGSGQHPREAPHRHSTCTFPASRYLSHLFSPSPLSSSLGLPRSSRARASSALSRSSSPASLSRVSPLPRCVSFHRLSPRHAMPILIKASKSS